MSRKTGWIAGFVVLIGLLLAGIANRPLTRDDLHALVPWPVMKHFHSNAGWFQEHPLASIHARWLYDYGVADVNSDGFLDIYTTNHNWRQTLLLSNGKGGFQEGSWSALGASQDRNFPDVELSLSPPVAHKPGLYVYWLGEDLVLRAHDVNSLAPVQGRIRAFLEGQPEVQGRIQVEELAAAFVRSGHEGVVDTRQRFSATGDGVLRLRHSPEFPVQIAVDANLLPHVYVGSRKLVPKSADFELVLRDRHAAAWADLDGDGQLDVFITRDAMGGTLRALPEDIRRSVKDELLLSGGGALLEERGAALGISKDACNGRHASWVDFDNDGRLDLLVNCQDTGRVPGTYPKQLYQQTEAGIFRDVAAAVGLDLPDDFVRAFKWADVDNDGDPDLFAHLDSGFFLFRNQAGRFSREFVHRAPFTMADQPRLKFDVTLYWRYDGQISVADFDGDGDLDLFVSSKRGNAMFVNVDGRLSFRDPLSMGLPKESAAAVWTDFDNDGQPDLHAVPQGLFWQTPDHRFQETNLLVLPSRRYMAAIVNWFDMDSDGRRDVSLAVIANPGARQWWESGPVEVEDWATLTYRNVGATSHWLQVDAAGPQGNRQGVGARVTVVTSNRAQTQEIGASEGSAQSQGHYRLYFGLGSQNWADTVIVRWPDGHVQELTNVKADRLLVVRRNPS